MSQYLRTYGRLYAEDGSYQWVEVATDANGDNDEVMITTLAQVLALNLGESPMFGNYGIPAQQSVITQIFPDWYVWQTQAQFSPFFASLIIVKENSPTPSYRVNIVTNAGAVIPLEIPV